MTGSDKATLRNRVCCNGLNSEKSTKKTHLSSKIYRVKSNMSSEGNPIVHEGDTAYECCPFSTLFKHLQSGRGVGVASNLPCTPLVSRPSFARGA